MSDEWMLAVETSSLRGSVALACGEHVIAAHVLSAERKHTAELFPTIAEVLRSAGRQPADITIFAYSAGPGSFTGLRIAATFGRMLQSAVGCRVVAAPTLEVVARNALANPAQPGRLAVILDARREQVYGGLFERVSTTELRTITQPAVRDPGAWLASLEKPFWILGDGIARCAAACAASGGEILAEAYWPPTAHQVIAVASRLAAAGRFCRPEEIVPFYLRPPECEEVYEQRRAAARARRGA